MQRDKESKWHKRWMKVKQVLSLFFVFVVYERFGCLQTLMNAYNGRSSDAYGLLVTKI